MYVPLYCNHILFLHDQLNLNWLFITINNLVAIRNKKRCAKKYQFELNNRHALNI